jgi:hypothetical protein
LKSDILVIDIDVCEKLLKGGISMGKFIRNIFAKILVTLMLIPPLCINAYAENDDLVQKEYQSLNTYKTITEQLNLNDSLSSWQYPDYYAGMYINDNKELVFLLAQNATIPNETETFITSLGVKIEFVEHSLKELKKAQEDILTVQTYSLNTQEIYTAIDILNNCLDVSVNSSNVLTYSSNELASIGSLDYVNINYTNQNIEFLGAPLQPGRSINSPSTRTVGYWAQNSAGTIGIVTASHGAIVNGSAVYIDGTYFGVAQTAVYQGTADAVFVKRDNLDFAPSNTIMGWGYTIQSNASINLPVGATVYSYGKTSGAKSGIVTKTGVTVSNGAIYVQDAVQTSFSGAGGDSGGPVCGGLSNNTVLIAGTIEALSSDGYLIYCKALNIRTSLGVYPY